MKLDGREFSFDDDGRMTGTGTWRLLNPGAYRGGLGGQLRGGQQADSIACALRRPDPTIAASRTASPPKRATWDLGVTKGKKGELLLVFLTADTDMRDTYYLTKDGVGTS
ncbi:hypothetical protein [Streptomyces aurantiogriseus]|uniref:Uncharacterized protein n=1 Tax=Streptomyces aurantiogriseus TaxID=66870 RepID=A0A918FLY6_9ACTN|nr:hypothetical protein [Streptomyces aurantiogriseus]GGR53494.1 hypothetical protein GCM10010251_83100 [Streptomyces aurantiogriseus]